MSSLYNQHPLIPLFFDSPNVSMWDQPEGLTAKVACLNPRASFETWLEKAVVVVVALVSVALSYGGFLR